MGDRKAPREGEREGEKFVRLRGALRSSARRGSVQNGSALNDRHGATPRESPLMKWLTISLLLAIVVGGSGFIYKLVQFSHEALAAEGASFAIVPIVVYVCVALGFLFLFVWAVLRGQFRDVEGPKHRLLEEEELYDALDV